MSHAALRDEPTKSQRYLDDIIRKVKEQDESKFDVMKPNSEVNLAEILLCCMKANPFDVLMINGATGVQYTNKFILDRSLSFARAILARGATGKTILFVLRNHQQLAVVYYGAIFSGAVPFIVEPNSTVYELQHFIELVSPLMVFCDEDRYEDVRTAVDARPCAQGNVTVTVANSDSSWNHFIGDPINYDSENFQLPRICSESTVMMLPTSGSTGLQKATVISHQGLVAQLPSLWTYMNRFPRPTELVMILSTGQWITHTIFMTTCPVYRVPMLMSPHQASPDYVITMIHRFEPSCTILSPAMTSSLAAAASPGQLKSLQLVFVTGSPLTPQTMNSIKNKLAKSAYLCNTYGMTEMHGSIALSTSTSTSTSTASSGVGKILNYAHYKIVAEDGHELAANRCGELYLKSELCVFKGYLNNIEAYEECITIDGWFKTGDIFYKDDKEQLYFVARNKFTFKYLNYHISPEEIEKVIGNVPGVQQCAVGGSQRGAAALVVPSPLAAVTRAQIHTAVNSNLSDYKRLDGGVAFVASLPHSTNGKLNRKQCSEIINDLTLRGLCF